MKYTTMKLWTPIAVLAIGMLSLPAVARAQEHVLTDFSNLSLDPDSYWNGSDLSGTLEVVPNPWFPGSTMDLYHGGFESDDLFFSNTYNAAYWCWDGFAYSNKTDTTTPGYANQYSAITGDGYGDSSTYGVAYWSVDSGRQPTITPAAGVGVDGGVLDSVMVTNTTWAYFSMRDGDTFARRFGWMPKEGVIDPDPADPDDWENMGDYPDWFNLIIEGFDGATSKGTVEFLLADYTSDISEEDYIVDEWTEVDLKSLGYVDQLEFTFASSDVGTDGMNTPAYVALGQVTAVPEPSTVALALSGALALLLWWRRRRNA